jgi:hypothetical protein
MVTRGTRARRVAFASLAVLLGATALVQDYAAARKARLLRPDWDHALPVIDGALLFYLFALVTAVATHLVWWWRAIRRVEPARHRMLFRASVDVAAWMFVFFQGVYFVDLYDFTSVPIGYFDWAYIPLVLILGCLVAIPALWVASLVHAIRFRGPRGGKPVAGVILAVAVAAQLAFVYPGRVWRPLSPEAPGVVDYMLFAVVVLASVVVAGRRADAGSW